MWFVYILQCKRGILYTGITTSLRRRLGEHRNKKVQFTSCKLPVKIVFSELFPSKSQALEREVQIKNWTRKKKFALIDNNFALLKKL